MTLIPKRAMVLAAGLGTRMRPLSDERPKPLMVVAGRTLIDRVLDHLVEAGVERAVVNTHYKGEMVRDHLAARSAPEILYSDESDQLLDTGGGVKRALGALGPSPFFVVNGDTIWSDGAENTLSLLARRWDDGRMDALLLAQPTVTAAGYDGLGDFFMAQDGALERRREWEVAPFVFAGIQILHPRLFDGAPEGPFSLNTLYLRAGRAGRLFGQRHEGLWWHVGTPEALDETEQALAGTGRALGE